MDRLVYLSGEWVPEDRALVSAQDRGFIFADGVYEVVRYYSGRPVAMAAHADRLRASLDELRIQRPPEMERLPGISDEVVRKSGMSDATVYWQVTRGVGPRDRRFPDPAPRPTVYVAAAPAAPFDAGDAVSSMAAITHEEIRWPRNAIKSISLLPTVLARQAAADAGCDEAIFVQEDVVTEGTSTSILAVHDGEIMTHPLDGGILGSITRGRVLEAAREMGFVVQEVYLQVDELRDADEVMAVGTTTEVAAVSTIDGEAVGDGRVGPVATRLAGAYRSRVGRECGLAES